MSEKLQNHLPVFECFYDECDIHELWRLFEQKLFELRDAHVPSIDSARLKKRRKPWVTASLIKMIRKRRRAYLKFKRTKREDDFSRLLVLTREHKEKLKTAKEEYFKTLDVKMKKNPKLFWHYLRECGTDSSGVGEIVYNQQVISGDLEKATCFNNHFKSVFSPNHINSHQHYTSYAPAMPPVEISVRGILALLEDIDESKACGPDGISPRLLKNCAYPISQYLCLIYKKSLDTGLLPHDWKIAHVVPIHKGGSRKDVSNYRPISLTSVSCKIFEHILYTEIMNHLVKNDLLMKEQHGFRKGLSCTTQLVEFYHELVSEVDRGGQTDCIFLDFRKAFDTVSHPLLLYKLKMLNLDTAVIVWIQNYLLGRRQRVVLNGVCSDYVDVTSGVPQWSVLGPLLFLIYINDISLGISSSIRLFADDCVLYRKINNANDVVQLQTDLTLIHDWCLKWKMSLNTEKYAHLCFSRKKIKVQAQYRISNELITQKCTYRYLGVILTDDCSWNAHVDHVVTKAGRALNFIQRSLRSSQPNLKKTAFLSCVRPIIEYACIVWDPAHRVLIEKLEKIHNRAARFVLGRYGRRDSCTAMKKELQWEPLASRRRKLRLKLLYLIVHGKTGIDFENYLKQPFYVSQRHDHSRKIREYRTRTNLFASSFFVKTVQQWNRLSEEQVCSASEDVFFANL